MDFAKETCCFTGHRKIPPEQLDVMAQRLEETILACINDGYKYFGAGGALGFDTIAALKIIELRDRFPQIKLILVLPCRSQTRGWKKEDGSIGRELGCIASKGWHNSRRAGKCNRRFKANILRY